MGVGGPLLTLSFIKVGVCDIQRFPDPHAHIHTFIYISFLTCILYHFFTYMSSRLDHPAPLLPRRPCGVIAVGSLRGSRRRSLALGAAASSSSSPPSRGPPRRLPLQQGAVGVQRVEVQQQRVLSRRREAALLADVQLVAPLLVGVLLGDAVDLLHVGLQGAALGEGLVAERALVGPDACLENARGVGEAGGYKESRSGIRCVCVCVRMKKKGERVVTCVRADVSLEVKGVVEALPAEAAQVPLGVVVALEMPVQHALVREGLLANLRRRHKRKVCQVDFFSAPTRKVHSSQNVKLKRCNDHFQS